MEEKKVTPTAVPKNKVPPLLSTNLSFTQGKAGCHILNSPMETTYNRQLSEKWRSPDNNLRKTEAQPENNKKERLWRDLVPEGFRDSCPCSTWIPPSPGVTAFPGRYSKPPTEQKRNKGIMNKLLPLYTTDDRCNILKKRKKICLIS
ncbi:unnamed protein product [Gulo gulo]|uniref:Uncharacterized protein n=1 Tax=Gulo gulo TaxID=48420 RepID=A0A9X9Q0P6_GULGU|nr:unnamed protein product [Gulo gulo]